MAEEKKNPYEEQVQRAIDLRATWEIIKDCEFDFHAASDRIILSTQDLVGLRELRKRLRTTFGSWKDHLLLVWSCGRQIITSYESPDHHIHLWLYSKPEAYESLGILKDGCKLEKRVRSETTYEVVCEI